MNLKANLVRIWDTYKSYSYTRLIEGASNLVTLHPDLLADGLLELKADPTNCDHIDIVITQTIIGFNKEKEHDICNSVFFELQEVLGGSLVVCPEDERGNHETWTLISTVDITLVGERAKA